MHEQHRQRGQQDDRRGIEHRAAHLDHGTRDDGQRRLAFAPVAGLAQPAHDVVDAEDRVVDDHGHRKHQPGDDHHVDVATARCEDPGRGQQRTRDDHGRNQRGPPAAEQRPEPQHHQHQCGDDPGLEIAGGALDETCRPIDLGVDLDALHARAQLAQRLLDTFGHLGGVGAGKLFDHKHQTGAFFQQRITDQRLVGFDDRCHLAQRQ